MPTSRPLHLSRNVVQHWSIKDISQKPTTTVTPTVIVLIIRYIYFVPTLFTSIYIYSIDASDTVVVSISVTKIGQSQKYTLRMK